MDEFANLNILKHQNIANANFSDLQFHRKIDFHVI